MAEEVPELGFKDCDPENFKFDSFNATLNELHASQTYTTDMIQAARDYASVFSDYICSAYTELNEIVTRHEVLIRKRWMKKTVLQRREILLAACKEMPLEHGSNVALRAELLLSKNQGEISPKERVSSLVWPYINVEDLTKPKSLLIYINSRARNSPWTFAINETDFSPHGLLTSKCPFKVKKGASMRFGPELDPRMYGEVREDHCCSEQLATDHIHADLVEGLQIIGIQSHIMAFLTSCCGIILQDMDMAQILSAPIQDEPPSLEISANVEGHKNFSDALVVAPYLKRREIDLQRLQSYIDAVCDEMKDHVFMLREDPSYFTEVYAQIAEHRPENLPVKEGRHDRFDEFKFPRSVLTTLVSEAHEWLFLWHGISTEVNDLSSRFQGLDTSKKLQAILRIEKLLDSLRSRLL